MAHISKTRQLPTIPGLVLLWYVAFSTGAGVGVAETLYPFEITNQVDQTTTDIPLKFSIPFFGGTYSSIHVSKHGYMSLTKNYRNFNRNQYPNSWPNKKYPQQVDPSLIAPYYAEVNLQPNAPQDHNIKPPGYVTWQAIERDTRKNIEFLERLNSNIKTSIVGAQNFNAKFAFMATWVNVTCQGCFAEYYRNYPKNTFQAVVATDSVQTYVIFKYKKITWTGGTQTKGSNKGLGAKYPPAQAGFNAGYGRRWVGLPPSATDNMVHLDDADKGKYVFNVASENILIGGCTEDVSGLEDQRELQLSPKFGSMLGGNVVEVSGPCFDVKDNIKCMFGNKTLAQGQYVSASIARCTAPILYVRGIVAVTVSRDGGSTWFKHGYYTVVLLGRKVPSVDLVEKDKWTSLNPDYLVLRWNKTDFIEDSQTTAPPSMVSIKLFGYKEMLVGQETKAIWTELKNLSSEEPNSGMYTFRPQDHQCPLTTNCYNYDVGAVQITTVDTSHTAKVKLWSALVPLGWYMKNSVEYNYGDSWVSDKCYSWYNNDRVDSTWLTLVPSCPCQLEQALADFGRWQPDVSCNMNTGGCKYHVGAVHCVRSAQPLPVYGAGNQCCYRANGTLMYTSDTHNGSTPDRSHDWGAPPYGKPPLVPSMSHWKRDVISFYYCCLWSEGMCNYYMDRRPTSQCRNYVAPKPAMVFGNAHFITFDSKTYAFNGKGDFFLLRDKSGRLDIHGRFQEPLDSQDKKIQGTTILMAVAMQYNSDTVEVHLNRDFKGAKAKVTIIVQGQPRTFDEPWKMWQDFENVTVIKNNPSSEKSNFTILLNDGGIGVQVVDEGGLLTLIVMLPPTFKNATEGLLGSWNDDKDNEVSFAPKSSWTVYMDLKSKWEVKATDKIFQYPAVPSNFGDLKYMPHIEVPSSIPSNIRDEARVFCGENEPCKFDYMLAGKSIAEITKNSFILYEELRKNVRQVHSCDPLPVPYGVKDSYDYTVGSTVILTGCTGGYEFRGANTYTCTSDSGKYSWNNPVTAKCLSSAELEEQRGKTDSNTVVAVVLPLAGLIFIVIFVLLYCKIRRKSRHRTSRTDRKSHSEEAEYPSSKYGIDDDVKQRFADQSHQISMDYIQENPGAALGSNIDNLDKTESYEPKLVVDLPTSEKQSHAKKKQKKRAKKSKDTTVKAHSRNSDSSVDDEFHGQRFIPDGQEAELEWDDSGASTLTLSGKVVYDHDYDSSKKNHGTSV